MAKDDVVTKYDYSFQVLEEKVADTDLFEDKTHERVASTLKSLISTAKSGLTVGLEGGWGSGKSTVINLLKKDLDAEPEQDKSLFFSFDAWAHDGDPLRKIFLESLIEAIDPNRKDKTLNDLREKVSARKKSVSISSKKDVSLLGKWLSASALLIPLGAALLSTLNFENIVPPWADNAGTPSLVFVFGLLFSFSPLITFVLWLIFGTKDKKTGKPQLDIFQTKSEENFTQDITEDGERTSIEFERFFSEVLSHIFAKESDYNFERVIIVIDNLDRVDAEYAQSVWSTLQTFFQHRSSSTKDKNVQWADKLWFLIPYDREGIRRAWAVDENNETCNVASSFMEKCFQVVTEVPTPVMSAWISYLESCVERAFTGWPSARKKEFRDTYTKYMSKLDDSPSPRQIHNQINRAGMLAMHWKDEVSAEAICLYAIYRQEKSESELRNALLGDELPNDYIGHHSTQQLKKELAGMLFGVTAEKGMQLLLAPEIKKAIKDGDGEYLSQLEKLHEKAFWVALKACKDQWILSDSHVDEYKINIVKALYEAFKNKKAFLRQYIAQIKHSYLWSFDNWNLDEFNYSAAIEQLVELSTQGDDFLEQLRTKLQQRISRNVRDFDSEKLSEAELIAWRDIEATLGKFGEELTQTHYKELDVSVWPKWLNVCESAGVRIKSVLPIKPVFEQLVENASFSQAAINPSHFDILQRSVKHLPETTLWKVLTDHLVTWLKRPDREYDIEEVYNFVITWYGLASTEDKKRIDDCVASPGFWQNGVHSTVESNPSLPVLVAICCPDFQDNESVSPAVKKALSYELPEKELKLLSQAISESNTYDRVWELAKDRRNLFALQLIRSEFDSKLFETGARFVDEIQWRDDEELSSITQKLCDGGAIEAIRTEIEDNPIAYNKTLFILHRFGEKSAKQFAYEVVRNLSREQWSKAIVASNDLLLFVPNNNTFFSKAWADFLKGYVQSKSPEYSLGKLKALIELKDKVVDFNITHCPEITQAYFENPDEDLLTSEEFEALSTVFEGGLSSVEQNFVERRVSYWIEQGDTEKLNWLANSGYSPRKAITNEISSITAHGLEQLNKDLSDVCVKINDIFRLKLNASEILSKKVDSANGDEQE